MTGPLRVAVVRRRTTASEFIGHFVARWAFLFLQAWLAMLLLPLAFDVRPGFWQTFAGVWVVRMLLAQDSEYLQWTHAPDNRRSS